MCGILIQCIFSYNLSQFIHIIQMNKQVSTLSKIGEKNEDYEFPSPIDPSYMILTQLPPWRKDQDEEASSKITTNQIWTQLEQGMYDLQMIGKEDIQPTYSAYFENPYPQ